MRVTRLDGTADNCARPIPTLRQRKAWLRALDLTAPIAAQSRSHSAHRDGGARRSNWRSAGARYPTANALPIAGSPSEPINMPDGHSTEGIAKGEVVGLLMTNRPEYLAVWLGHHQRRWRRFPAQYQSARAIARPLHPRRVAQTSHRRRGVHRPVGRDPAASAAASDDLASWQRARFRPPYRSRD